MKILNLAIKEIKNTPLQLFIFFFCVVISVSAFVFLENFNTNIDIYLENDAKILAGGDLIVESRRPYQDNLSNILENISQNYITTNIYEFSTNILSIKNNNTAFVQLKVVGDNYPLYGEVNLKSGKDFKEIPKQNIAIVEENLLVVLNISLGDYINIGESQFLVYDTIINEPDRPFELFSIGERVLIFERNLEEINLVGDRSRVEFNTYIKTNQEEDLVYLQNLISQNLGPREEVNLYSQSQESFSEFIDIFLSFMRLILFFTIILSGIGMISTLNSFISKKEKSIAIFKVLGFNNQKIKKLFLLISFIISFFGVIIGIFLGLGLLYLIPTLFPNLLPNNFQVNIYLLSILRGVLFAFVVTLLFSLIPLAFLKNIKPNIILHDMSNFKFKFQKEIFLLIFSLFIFFFYLVSSQFSNFFISLIFIFSFIFLFIFIYFLSFFLLKLLFYFKNKIKNLALRQALVGFFRPGSKTILFITTMSTALVLIFTIFILEVNIENQFVNEYPPDAPNLFFLDLRKDQLDNFSNKLNYSFRFYPTISGGIIDVKGIDINTFNENLGSGDPVTRDFSLTYYEELLSDEILIKPSSSNDIFELNWDKELVQISIMDTMAERLSVDVGDKITFLIQGIEISGEVVSIRQRTNSGVSPFFYFVFQTEVLENAPQTIFTTGNFDENKINDIKNQVSREFPQISIIDVTQTANRVLNILTQLSSFILFFTIFSLISGFLILISSIISTSSQRLKEVIFYKLVGADKKFILKTIFFEYLFLGLLSSTIGLFLATIVTFIISIYFLEINYSFFPIQSLILVLITTFIVLFIGIYGSIKIIRKKPIEYIRENSFE